MYSLKIHKSVLKFLKSRNSSEKKTIQTKLNLLKDNPFSHQYLDIKRIKGNREYYRLRIGKIRIIYQVIDTKLIILVMSAGSRGNIYKKKT